MKGEKRWLYDVKPLAVIKEIALSQSCRNLAPCWVEMASMCYIYLKVDV